MSTYCRVLAFFLFLLWSGVSNAQESFGEEDEDEYETVVTPSRQKEDRFKSPRAIERVPSHEFVERGAATTPQALEDTNGVYMQRTNSAGGAPIVRGLLGQHVLLLVDGVRLNNAITRFGPNQLLNTVDPFQLTRIEVLRGPGSVVYGSDSIGGVINLITKRPEFDAYRAWDWSAEGTGRFYTTGLHGLAHIGAEGHLRGFGLRVGGTFKQFNDFHGGQDTGLQKFTGYLEGDAYASGLWKINDQNSLKISYSTVRQYNAARTDKSSPRDFRVFRNQIRDLASLTHEGRFDGPLLKHIRTTLSFHHQQELRERFRLDNDLVEREEDRVGALGLNLFLRTDLPYNQFNYGLDLYYDYVLSSAENETISLSNLTRLDRGRYVNDSRYGQFAFFLVDRVSFFPELAFDVGGRINVWWVSIPEDPSEDPKIDALDTHGTAVVGSLHARYLIGTGLNLVAGLSQGYRAPNIDDYSALGCSGQGFDIPNPDLGPESSVTAEAGIKLNFDLIVGIEGSLFYYFTYLTDVIVRMPTTWNTESGTTTDVQCGTSEDGEPMMTGVTHRGNANDGKIHGIEAKIALKLGHHWTISSWFNWTHGTVVMKNGSTEPLGRAPPINGLFGLRYKGDDRKWFTEVRVRWAAPQSRLSSGDLQDTRICPNGPDNCEGTPAFVTIDIHGAVRVHKHIRLTLTAENLTNETYKFHGSGIYGPGISAIIGAEVSYP